MFNKYSISSKKTNGYMCLAVFSFLLFTSSIANAKWRGPDQEVPLERIVENTKRYLSEHPDDATAYAQLGRAYNLAYSRETTTFGFYGDWTEDNLPTLVDYYTTSFYRPNWERDGRLSPNRQEYLTESIRYYQKAVELDKTNYVYWLGLGFMYGQGAQEVQSLVWPFLDEPFDEDALVQAKRGWEEKALQAYEKVMKYDTERVSVFSPVAASEAAMSIVEIYEGRKTLNDQEQKRLEEVKAELEKMPDGPRAKTPIIFSLERAESLSNLLSKDTRVTFDLAGDDIKRTWSWVSKDTSILVWDPDASGSITSGRQLFGSVTWWFFWENGYRALFVLDDDGDGWLRGSELDGLAVWTDANQNGKSEPGEVLGIKLTGVIALAVQETGMVDGSPYNPAGILMNDGRVLPTYDWVTESL